MIFAAIATILVIAIIFLSGLISNVITADMGPTSYEHDGAIITSRVDVSKKEFKIGERVNIVPQLVNIGNKSVMISHSDPAFIIDVYNAAGAKVWAYQFPQLSVAHIAELKPDTPYKWDEDILRERYDIRLSFPGQYKIISHTEFLIEEPGKAELEKGIVYSEPILITVVP